MFGQLWRKVKAKIHNALLSPAPVADKADELGQASDYFIRSGYTARLKPEYFQDTLKSSDGKVYQPDVYRMAEAFGRFASATHLVDVGCGRAAKLVSMSDQFEIVGLDFGDNIEYCKSTYPFGTWLTHDFEKDTSIPLGDIELSRALVVCADVIEHLVEPRRLLTNLKRCADRGALVMLSTPERVLVQGIRDMGPPRNVAHVREWSIGELRALLLSIGFEIVYMGLTADNDDDREMSTIIAVLS